MWRSETMSATIYRGQSTTFKPSIFSEHRCLSLEALGSASSILKVSLEMNAPPQSTELFMLEDETRNTIEKVSKLVDSALDAPDQANAAALLPFLRADQLENCSLLKSEFNDELGKLEVALTKFLQANGSGKRVGADDDESHTIHDDAVFSASNFASVLKDSTDISIERAVAIVREVRDLKVLDDSRRRTHLIF